MKSKPHSIHILLFFPILTLFCWIFSPESSKAQGFNDNEWIFGYCGGSTENSYLSFGKGTNPSVQTLPGSVIVDKYSNSLAIDPITGQPFFYSNGSIVYDYSGAPIQGQVGNLNGPIDTRQQVATGFLEYDPEGNKLFYLFYVSPGGQLLYTLIDMNAPGQATGNERPLGEITEQDQVIGNAQGAILVVKSPSSPSYLISFDGGNLISRRLDDTSGSFTETSSESIPFTPKAILYDEDNGQLILIPENAGEDILVLDFDTSGGTFGSPNPVSESGGTDPIEGATYSPDGEFLYFSRGNQLFRVPSSDLGATPEEIPLDPQPSSVYDLKVGPDGELYFIYEEVDGGPQLIGRVTNPNEVDLALIEVEIDPFTGTDFCGTIFPTFAPNADVGATVDFTWEPEEPCANNPVQLTSVITPENYQPVSFDWQFNPPLTDSDGNPLDADYEQEHFLIPADATQGQSVSVTLVVTYADGTTSAPVTKDIPLTENNLEANFNPSDTTICEGQCVDIAALLQAQSAEGEQGGEAPGSGGENYEYFWSNYRDEGWTSRDENEVCLPGLYWVLVREPGSSCYAYAEIRVKVWDLDDQSNNIWYFGDGAGLDFNPDPDDPNAPTPRPIAERHPQNIPAGTTTISDETGQVLFFTDGESVWDLNGTLMENGDAIGGDNGSSQGVIAVPVPQEQTLFYLFTTQQSANGTNEVKFSLVDIKSDNQEGVGNIVTKDNFLFSPSTEHSAAFSGGDSTWVLFHELGNNTFRAYPVSSQGIGQPVMSSVGSSHGFNSGVGAMKFSPDGSQVAVTISEGGCNKLEIFDFDADTGEMTEYARIDLGCDGDVYGLEFSDSGEKVFVSYRNGGPGIEEFAIKAVENDDPEAATCPACFDGASTRPQIEACILSTRNTINNVPSDIGALQIGPDGNIYVAVVGSNQIGQIAVGSSCGANSTFNMDAVEPMPGTTNLGLPSFVQNSGSSIPEPALVAPERLCLDPEEGASALIEGGGEPDIDSYFWTITRDDGTVILSNFGGPGDEFQTLDQVFSEPGTYTVELDVTRCATENYFNDSIEIQVDAPPVLTLPTDATLCSGNPVTLTAIDGYDPSEGIYDFQWTDAAGQVYGDENSNTITVEDESIYTVTVTFRLPEGLTDEEAELYETCPATAEVFVGPAFEFEINQDAQEVCYEETVVNFAPDTPISGEWFYELNEDGNRVSLGEYFELELWIDNLPGPGDYEIIFVTEDPILEGCVVEKSMDLLVNALPDFDNAVLGDATDCSTADGAFQIIFRSSATTVTILETGLTFTNVSAGDFLQVPDLLPGLYTVVAENEFGCTQTKSQVIGNENPPASLSDYGWNLIGQQCGPTGIEDGGLEIFFNNGPQSGEYRITRQENGQVFSGMFTNSTGFTVLLPHGTYYFELLDSNGCSNPTNNGGFQITEIFQVDFSAPTNFTACESFTFQPTPDNGLTFTLTGPFGNVIPADANGEFTIGQTGVFTLLGEDPSGVNCPREIQINATITQTLDYQLIGPIDDCQTGVRYEAQLNNADPADVTFLWRDNLGVIVGRQQSFAPPRDGEYSLEVQPQNGGLCQSTPISFTAELRELSVDVELDVTPFCVDQTSTTLAVLADMTDVAAIEWYLVEGGTRTRLFQYDDMPIIDTAVEGTYEVLLRSAAGCDLGRDSGVVARSVIVPPVLPSSITICAIEGNSISLDPGDYDNYSWILNGEEISQDAIFTPTLPGIYELTVSDNLGCSYSASIEVIEDCDLKIIFPTGVVLDDPTRNFILYANEYIDFAEVFIFNRWGELIFHCDHENLEPAQPFCPWDGIVNGKTVPNGTYAVLVKFTSRDQNKTEQITKAVTIIQ